MDILDYLKNLLAYKTLTIESLAREKEFLIIENSNLRDFVEKLQKQVEDLQDELGTKPKIYVSENI